MKILLIGEASGVHENLKKGLVEIGCSVFHMIRYKNQQGRTSDGNFSPEFAGLVGGVTRNIVPLAKSLALPKYDAVNFLNTISAVHGQYTKYFDLPIIRTKTNVMSYYAVGCDELGIIRRSHHDFSYTPCHSCLKSMEMLGRNCEAKLNPIYEQSVKRAEKYFDVAACSMIEYDHVAEVFSEKPFRRIPLPIDDSKIRFSPAKGGNKIKVAHAPTRRGFKGTDVVFAAIEKLRQIRHDFEFITIEGLSYQEYLQVMDDVDVVIDQVYSQSPGMNALEMMCAGKIVLTGATEMGTSYFDFMGQFPGYNASPDATELAGALDNLLGNRRQFAEIAEASRNYVTTHHSCQKAAMSFVDLWQNTSRLDA